MPMTKQALWEKVGEKHDVRLARLVEIIDQQMEDYVRKRFDHGKHFDKLPKMEIEIGPLVVEFLGLNNSREIPNKMTDDLKKLYGEYGWDVYMDMGGHLCLLG